MPQHRSKPIFYDPTRTRARRLAAGALIATCGIAALLLAFLVGLDRDAVLPLARLASPRAILRPIPRDTPPPRKPPLRRPLSRHVAERALERRFPRTVSLPDHPLRLAFYVDWDDASLTSLRQNASRLDGVIPEWLHLADDAGGLTIPDGARRRLVEEALRPGRERVRLLPMANNYDSSAARWEGGRLERILFRPAARRRLLRELVAFASSGPFQGLCLDFESLPPRAARAYPRFLQELGTRLHARGKILLACTPMASEDLDYPALAGACDLLVLMAYDEHWAGSEPGPVASEAWYRSVLAERLGEIPGYRVLLALGEYGYDWGPRGSVRELTVQEALATARESDAHPAFLGNTRNPGYSYEDERGEAHRVWYLDAATTWNQIRETLPLHPGGYVLWRLGSEDPSLWSFFGETPFPEALPKERAERLDYGYDLDYEGRGEVLRVAALPRRGQRQLFLDSQGRVRDEHILAFPGPYEIDRWGHRRGWAVLTFDDGPDPKYTPRILDILRREGAPAVFFVIGANANLHPDLVRRELLEGNEVGNHTFRHPDVSRVGPETLRLELNATQRLLEARCGVQTLLFRPPYGEDIEPVRPDQIRPVLEASRMGYLTVGMGVDPSDWMRPGTAAIVRNALRQLDEGRGNVILLHDGGGERSQTVEALPELIRRIRGRGYRLVSLSELLGLPPGGLNPPVTGAERVQATLTEGFFGLLEGLFKAISATFLAGLILGILRVLFVTGLALLQARIRARERRLELAEDPASLPPVSVLIPCYNEARVVTGTLRSLLASDHPSFEVLLVDDGSTDGTAEAAEAALPPGAPVRILRQPNGGKASALNRGLAEARFEVILVVDADTNLEPQALRALARRFRDPRVGAAAGNAKVGNRRNLLTRWQALEYVASQNLERRAYELLNGILVVPGAVGAWRRDILLSLGGFPDRTLAEDADMTLEVLRAGWRIVYEEEARGWTEVPETPRAFLKQRFRWAYGTLQVLWHNRRALFDPRLGPLGWIALPDAWISKILLPLLAPLGDCYALGILIRALWTGFEHPLDEAAALVPLETVLLYLALFILVEIVSSAVAILLEPQEDPRLLPWVGLQRFFYRQLLYGVSLRSLLTALRGVGSGWNKLDRTGSVRLPGEGL